MLSATKPVSQRSVALVRSNETLTFPTGHARPETFASFLAWLEAIDPVAASKALAAAQASYPEQPQLFVVAPNATVGIRLEFLPAIWKSFRRPQALAHFVDHHRTEVIVIRFTAKPLIRLSSTPET